MCNSDLLSLYKNKPCQVFPTAFWKVLNRNYTTNYTYTNGIISELELFDNNNFFLYFNSQRDLPSRLIDAIKSSKLILLHNDYYKSEYNKYFDDVRPYFRLFHDNMHLNQIHLVEEYSIVDVDFKKDAEMIADFIKLCYGYFKPSVDEVYSWMNRSVFDGHLWIWINLKSGEHVALAIAEIDKLVPEMSLEWIQVHPGHRGKGLASVLIQELLIRAKDKVVFSTVSGEVDNATEPEKVYRKNLFTGNDIWWCMRKKSR